MRHVSALVLAIATCAALASPPAGGATADGPRAAAAPTGDYLVQELRSEVNRLRAELQSERSRSSEEAARRSSAQKDVNDLRAKVAALAATIVALEARLQTLGGALNKERKEHRDDAQALTDARAENERVQHEVAQARQAEEKAKIDAARWREQAGAAEQKAREAEQRTREAQAQIARLERRIADLDAEKSLLLGEIGRLKALLAGRWKWIALAAVAALSVGALATRLLWPKKVPKPVSLAVSLGAWDFACHSAQRSRAANLALRATLLPLGASVRSAGRLVA